MRAILLAAGMGTRLMPLTKDTPKSLIRVNGTPLIERQIRMLKEIGIHEIIVVTGHLKNAFDYLQTKYRIKLVYNLKYREYNNIYTMYLVKEYLADAYVIDADIYLSRNFLSNSLIHSTYFTGEKDCINEWCLHWDRNNKVHNITIESGLKSIMSGVSYWNKTDAKIIVRKLEEKIDILLNNTEAQNKTTPINNLFWDDIVKENLNILSVYIKKINSTDWFEIDDSKDIKKLEQFVKKNR